MAGPTSYRVKKNGRAQDAIVTNDVQGLNALGISVVIDSSNMDRGDAARALTEVRELILEGRWPPF